MSDSYSDDSVNLDEYEVVEKMDLYYMRHDGCSGITMLYESENSKLCVNYYDREDLQDFINFLVHHRDKNWPQGE